MTFANLASTRCLRHTANESCTRSDLLLVQRKLVFPVGWVLSSLLVFKACVEVLTANSFDKLKKTMHSKRNVGSSPTAARGHNNPIDEWLSIRSTVVQEGNYDSQAYSR
jgi:hypothetical protein